MLVKISASAADDIAVCIRRVCRLADSNPVPVREQVRDAGKITLRAVPDKNLIRQNLHSILLEINPGDGFPKKSISLVRPISTERRGIPHLRRGVLQRLHHNRTQWLRHIPDPEADHIRIRMALLKLLLLLSHRGEQIPAGEPAEILIQIVHVLSLLVPTGSISAD